MPTAAQVLGKFASELKFSDIRPAVVERAKDRIINTVAISTFGSPGIVARAFLIAMLVMGAEMANGQQDYPNKPIRMVTAGVGGGNDFLSRLIAPGLSSAVGQQVTVENRGGSVAVPAELVGKAALTATRCCFRYKFLDHSVPAKSARTTPSRSLLRCHCWRDRPLMPI